MTRFILSIKALATRPMKVTRKRIPDGCKLPVLLSAAEIADIREHTFLDPEFVRFGVVQDNGSHRFDWPLGDIEEIQGYVAAAANHCRDSKLQKRLDRICSKLQHFLDSFDDQT